MFVAVVVATIAVALAAVQVTAGVEKVEVPNITNFSRVDDSTGFGGTTVGFGGATEPSAMTWLKSEGFATVINLRLETEEGADVDAGHAAAKAAGLQYIHLPFDTEHPDPQLVDNFLAAVGNDENQPIYIHCNSATRVGALWMISRVLKDGWRVKEASYEVEAIAGKPNDAITFAVQYITSRGK